ncbi:MAG: M20 family metallopeptidase [Candidatus Omnitrophica bacterium]|nr:M20 family metallopeptidase [Candidatus Omnitrophota bacterium]MDD5237191.1 M20 family metallopeptidase [Candidatus Omnitrophota bacterium]MDD5611340.1 M20 family metallopeptidase [Candidatus Omnitrophota bacterium]
MINKNRLIKLTQELIRIDSQNPPGNEQSIAQFVKQRLSSIGLRVKLYTFAPKRTNVVGILKAKDPRFSLLISPHLDTVPAGANWKFAPLDAKIHQGKIYGRGATDCKGNLASGIEALQSLVEAKSRLNYDIIFAATADEESGSGLGIIPLLEKRILRPDYAVILDSDDFKIVVAQKGLIHFKVCIRGKKAHGAYPWRGVNAIDIATRIIIRLKAYKFRYQPHRLLKAPTVNIGTIRGGDKVNMVADFCEFEVDIRFLPGMDARKILKDVKKIIQRQARDYKIEIEGIQEPYEIDARHPLVAGLVKKNQSIIGKKNLSGSEGATVITFFQDLHIPALAYGCGSGGTAHASDEYIKIKDLYRGAIILEEFLKSFKGDKLNE